MRKGRFSQEQMPPRRCAGGRGRSEAKRLKTLENENHKLKKLLAEQIPRQRIAYQHGGDRGPCRRGGQISHPTSVKGL